MRAAVLRGAGFLGMEEWPRPAIGPGELLLRLRGCGLVSHRLPLDRLAEGVALVQRHQALKVYVTP